MARLVWLIKSLGAGLLSILFVTTVSAFFNTDDFFNGMIYISFFYLMVKQFNLN